MANFAQQNLPAALPAVPLLLGCSALRAKDAFVAQAGRLFCAPQAGAPGTCASRKSCKRVNNGLYTRGARQVNSAFSDMT